MGSVASRSSTAAHGLRHDRRVLVGADRRELLQVATGDEHPGAGAGHHQDPRRRRLDLVERGGELLHRRPGDGIASLGTVDREHGDEPVAVEPDTAAAAVREYRSRRSAAIWQRVTAQRIYDISVDCRGAHDRGRSRRRAQLRPRRSRCGTPRADRGARRIPLHARQPPGWVPRQALDVPAVLGLRHRRVVERALQAPAERRRHRALGGGRPADPDRLRLRRPRRRRGGRPGRRGARLARRRRDPLPRHPARSHLDVVDGQRDRRHHARLLRRGRRQAGRAA